MVKWLVGLLVVFVVGCGSLDTRGLHSEVALLLEVESGEVLLDIRGTERMYPASMTKVMTALVVLEQLEDLQTAVYVDPALMWELQQANAALAGFEPGSWVSALDLLYGMMLPSGGEATLSLATAVGGSVEGFVQMMNVKARELGLVETNFVNPIGLHDPSHFTTAYELAELLRYGLDNPLFREIFMAREHRTAGGLVLESTLFGKIPRYNVRGGTLLGGRTGFTWEAGRCLISLAEIGGRKYVLVTGGAPNLEENRIKHLEDALTIFDQL